jgi:hypothetical protein
MEKSPWETNSHLASQEISHILGNLKVQHCVHKILLKSEALYNI